MYLLSVKKCRSLLLILGVVVFSFVFLPTSAFAAVRTSTATGGLWTVGTTWVGGVAPANTDSVIIATTGGNSVTIGAGVTNAGLTINSGAILSFTGAFTLTENGNVTVAGTINGATGILKMNASGRTIDGNGTINSKITIQQPASISTGSNLTTTAIITLANTLTIASGATLNAVEIDSNAKTVANNGTVNLSGNYLRTGGTSIWTQGTNAIVNIGGAFTPAGNITLNASASGNTVNYNGATQTIKGTTYYNLTLSGSGTASVPTGTVVNNTMSIAPTGSVVASVGAGLTITVANLTLGGLGRINGTWGSTSSTATYQNNTYFAATTGKLSVTNDTRATPTLSVTNSPQTYTGVGQSATVSGSVPGVVSSILTGGAATQTNAGTYAITADFAPTDGTSYKSLTAASAGNFTINKATPTISVSNSPQTYTGSPIAATISGSTPGSASNIQYDGSGTTPTNAGTYAITADFAPTDSTNYNSLTGASAGNFVIQKATPTISVSNSPQTYSGIPIAANISGSVSGSISNIKYNGSGTTPTNAGTYAVTANFVPTDSTNYNSLTDASAGNFVIQKATPTISVSNSPQTYSGSTISATVTGSVSGSVTNVKYNGSAIVPTNAGTYAITADFTPTDSTNYNSLTTASAGDFVINMADQTITFNALSDKSSSDPDFNVSASATSGLTVSFTSLTTGTCTVTGSTVHIVAVGTCTIRASQAGNSNYNAAPNVDRSFSIIQAATKFVIIQPSNGTVGTPVTVTVQVQKPDNSVDTNYQNDVTINTTGSATGAGLVSIVNGVGTIDISDTVAETITLSLTDSQLTGLDVSSTKQLTFAPGATTQFILSDPGDMYAKTRSGYTVARKDSYGNLVTSGTNTVYLYSTSVSATAKFYDDSLTGSIITSVTIADGQSYSNFWYYDEEPGTYTITASDNSSAPDGNTGIDDGTDSVLVIPVAIKFVIFPAINITVDNPATITVQAQKPDNSVDTNYQNDVTLNVDGSAIGDGLVNIINGVGTLNISDTVAETVNLSLTDSQSTGLDVSSTQQVVFAGGATAQFTLSDATTLSAGSRVQYTLTRKDQYNNLTTSGATTAYLYSSSVGANKKFYNLADGGSIITSINIPGGQSSVDFWYYDEAPGTYTITASDNSSAPDGNTNINDAADSLVVNAGPVATFILNNPGDMTAGTRLGYTVSRQDQFGNVVTSGDTTVYLYSSSATPTFYDASSGGTSLTSTTILGGQSSANFWYSDETPGTYTITASDNSSSADGSVGVIDATDSVLVNAAPIVATKFVILDPGNGTVDAPVSVTIQAQDNVGNLDTSYQNDVTLQTSGSATGGGLVSITNGVGTMSISDTAAETVHLTLVDSQNTNLNVSSTRDIIFATGNTAEFSLNNPGDMSAGTRLGYTVTRKDQFGNVVTNGLTVAYLYGLPTSVNKKFYDSASGGSVITFVNIPDGQSTANFWYYDEEAGTASVVVSDNATSPDGTSGIADVSDQVVVSAGAVSKYLLNNPGNMTVSTRLGYTVSRQDQFGNAVTSGVSLVYLYTTSSGSNARFYDSATAGLIVSSIPIDNGNSSANFWYYDEAPGTWVITVSDSTPTANGNTGITDDTDTVTVSSIPIVATRFVIIPPSNSSINVPVTVTVKAEDANSNVDTTYQNDVTLVVGGSGTGGGLVNIVNGVGTIQVNDTVAETIALSLSDTQSTGLNVSSVASIVFSALPPTFSGRSVATKIVPVVSKVTFTGSAYPGAKLSIAAISKTENVVKQSAVTTSSGNFEITFAGLSTGARAFALLVQDKDGNTAQSKVFDLNLISPDSTLRIDNIIVSPTVNFPRPTITRGDFLTVVGYGTPGSKITLQIDGNNVPATITAGTDGTYKYLYSTANLSLGSHTVRSQQTIGGRSSEFSPQKVFFTTNLTVPKTDFNNDGKINVSDWSIFLSRWASKDSVTRAQVDLNGDGKVDATDFSIFIRTLRQ